MSDDPRRLLEEAGQRPAPEPDPAFAAALEQRLLDIARGMEPVSPPAPRRRWLRAPQLRLAAGLAGAAAVVAILLVTGGIGVRDASELELTGSVNVEVALADGTTLVDPDGLLLPDGSVVTVGAGGSARIGDVVLRAGDVARVVDGRLRVEPPGSTASRPDRTPEPDVTPSSTPSPSPSPARPTPTAAVTSTPGPTPKPTDRPGGTATPAPTRSPDAPVPTAATPKPDPSGDAAQLKLVARVIGPSTVGVRWTGTPRARRYILLASVSRSGRASDPVYPGSRIVGEFTRPPDTRLVFRLGADVVQVRLLVVALAGDGTELARSNVARASFRR